MQPAGAKGAPTMELRVERIGPDRARELLEKNRKNRTVRPQRVEQIARDITNGEWRLTGDSIKLNGDGTLLDGQHRLLAIIKAGVPVELAVARGVEMRAMKTIDTGAPRTLTDILRLEGEKNYALLAASASWCWRYEHDALHYEHVSPSRTELLAWIDVNPGIRESVLAGELARKRIVAPASALAGIHYEAARTNRADADLFFEQLAHGAEIPADSPVLSVRRWLDNASRGRDKPRPVVTAAMIIKAYNAWRSGLVLRQLAWRQHGGEPFPKLDTREADAA